MNPLAEVNQLDEELAMPSLSAMQQIDQTLRKATQTQAHSATNLVLKQFADAATAGPLLCTINLQKRHGGAEQMPGYDTISWHGQAVASLAAAIVFESQADDLKTAAGQLIQMFMPGYRKNQLQQSRRAMSTLLRCLKFCLTSEGQQAVLAAVICLVALQIFVDDAAALQAICKEAAYSLGRNRSSVSQLAAWAVTSFTLRSKADCYTIANAGGVNVLVNQLQEAPLEALEGLAEMAELHAETVWESLLTFSGLTKLVDQIKAFKLHDEEGLVALSRLLTGLHKLVEHPHNQAAVLQELKRSAALELCFICAKSGVEQVSQPAIECLVFIWQWYLRKSPSASFSLTQMSSFYSEDALSTSTSDAGVVADVQRQAAVSAATAVAGTEKAMARDVSQLWSVEPVIDFASDRAAPNSPQGLLFDNSGVPTQQWQVQNSPMSDHNPSTGLPPKPSRSALPPQRAPPPPTYKPARVSSGSLASTLSPRAEADMALVVSTPSWHSSFSLKHARSSSSGSSPLTTTPSSPLLSFAKPRAGSIGSTADSPAYPASSLGRGQFTSSPDGQHSPASSSVTQQQTSFSPYRRSKSAPNPTANANLRPSLTANFSTPPASPVALSRRSLEQNSFAASTAGSTADSLFQQGRRHSLTDPDSRRSFSLFRSPFRSRSRSLIYQHPQQSLYPQAQQALQQDTAVSRTAKAQATSSSPPLAISHMYPRARTVPSRAASSGLEKGSAKQVNQTFAAPAVRSASTPAPPTSSTRGVTHTETDSLDYIQSWLNTNPEGHGSPFPFSHPSSPAEARSEGLERQSPSQQLPLASEARKPTQRALQFSPMSVTQPGAEVLHANQGKIPSLEDAYLRRREFGKDMAPAHEDSAWGSFNPEIAWSASASELVTTPRLGSRTSCDTLTHTGNHSVATIDNVSKPSMDSPNRFSIEYPSGSPAEYQARTPEDPSTTSPAGPSSTLVVALPNRSLASQPSRALVEGQKAGQSAAGKGKKWSRMLTWLTDPDTRDAARAYKTGKPIKRGALYDLATPIGRCPV